MVTVINYIVLNTEKIDFLAFLGGPVVKTVLPLQGPGFGPWSGKFHILCSAGKKQNKTKIHTALRARDPVLT